jgi:hypothetical protein
MCRFGDLDFLSAHSDLDDSSREGSDWNQVGDDGGSGDDENIRENMFFMFQAEGTSP